MKVSKAYDVPSYSFQHKVLPDTQKEAIPAAAKNFDSFTANQMENPMMQNTPQTIDQAADALRKQYPWVTFTFERLPNQPNAVPQFAVSAQNGIHLVIDPDILEWMAQGKESWAQGLEMIGKTLHDLMKQNGNDIYNKGAVIDDNGETTLWSAKWEKPKTDLEKNFEFMTDILEREDEAQKRQEEAQKKMKLEQKKKLNYQMGKDMARLAKVTTDRDVRSLISRMYSGRQKIAASSSYDKKEIQTALAQMDYVIGRARAKIRHLKEEEGMQARVKKAEKYKQEKRRMQLELELKTRRRNRIARERAAIYEKLPDLPGLRDPEERRDAQAQMMLNGAAAGAVSDESISAAPPADIGSCVVSMSPDISVAVTITPMA